MNCLTRVFHIPHTGGKDVASVTVRTTIYCTALSKGCTHEGYEGRKVRFLVLERSYSWQRCYLPGPRRGGPEDTVQEHVLGIKRLDRFSLLVVNCKMVI